MYNQEDSFDRELMDLMPEEVPEDLGEEVNPWYKPIMQIVWGLGLTSIQLHFFSLDAIMPAIGWLLLLLGFRTLRQENKWFRIAWIAALIGMSTTLFQLLINSTIWAGTVYSSSAYVSFSKMLMFLSPVMDLSFWLGLRRIRRKAGLNPGAWAALVLLFWHLLILVLALSQINSMVFMIVLLAAYISILVCLSQIPKALRQAGFECRAASVLASDRVLVCTLTGIAVVGVVCGMLFCQKYPMDWTPVSNEDNQQVQQVKEDLIDLGFPDFVLQDLRDEEVLALQGATRVVSGTDVHTVNEGRDVTWKENNTYYTDHVYDKKELRITGVAVLLPGEQEQWQIIHHFLWEEQPKFFGTESIRIIPADRIPNGWLRNDGLNGRVLCEKNGVTMEAPFWFLGEKDAIQGGFFGNPSTRTDIFAAFSLPQTATRQRGYLTYSVSEVQDGCIIYSWMDYTHRDSPLLYPNQSALDHQRSGDWDLKHRFPTIQTAIQFYPFREGNNLFGYEDK